MNRVRLSLRQNIKITWLMDYTMGGASRADADIEERGLELE